MNNELFPVETVAMDSPRLAWMKRHRVLTFHSMAGYPDALWLAGIDDSPGGYTNAADFFCCECGTYGSSRCGEGDTEDEAIADLAQKHGLHLWNEEAGA